MDKVQTGSPCACSIGGSDSGGGAGIQADIKTFNCLGVWGLTVITAITAQNPKRVIDFWPLPGEAVKMQIEAVTEEYSVKFFKTGMLANYDIIRTVSKSLPEDAYLVLDPVMISTSGTRLLEEKEISALTELLIPRADLLTPNLHEAAYIAGMDSVKSDAEIEQAGKKMLDFGAKAVLIKGGHGSGEYVIDTLITDSGISEFKSARFPYEVHGTGCCLSAAITSLLAYGLKIEDACAEAKKFINLAIKQGFSGNSNIKSVNPTFKTGNNNNKY